MSPLDCRFPDWVLQKIIDEATIYFCGCPAQVCKQIVHLRQLYEYQRECSAKVNELTAESHRLIAAATAHAHAELEECLGRVLEVEGWDRTTYNMPPGLRALQTGEVARWQSKGGQ